jgi:hypothetical protein
MQRTEPKEAGTAETPKIKQLGKHQAAKVIVRCVAKGAA